jgi:hypothetical protein
MFIHLCQFGGLQNRQLSWIPGDCRKPYAEHMKITDRVLGFRSNLMFDGESIKLPAVGNGLQNGFAF